MHEHAGPSLNARAWRARSSGRVVAAGLLLALLAGCGATPRQPPPSTDIDEDAYRTDLRRLTADEFEGRKPGTPGEDKTVAFLVARFRALGLKPANGDSYVQAVPLLELQSTSDPTLRVLGRGAPRSLAFAKEMVIWSPRRAPDVELAASELVFVGYGISAPEYAWNDYAGIDVRGKTVVVLLGDPGQVGADSKLFRGRSMSYYGYPTYKLEEAARQGASGVLLIHDADLLGIPWEALVNGASGAHLQLAAPPAGPPPPQLEGWLAGAAARALFAQGSLDFSAEKAAAAQPGFKAVPLGLRIDAAFQQTLRNFNSMNVVALLPGGKRRHDYIFYSAHWDALGRADHGSGEIYPGAVDDATGVAGLLVLAQSFRRTRPAPDRSIVFAAFTGAEGGLLGSRYYLANPLFPLADTVADLNLDRLHIGGPTRDVTDVAFGQSDLDAYLREAAMIQGRELHADPRPQMGEFFRSDDFSFAQAGVPALVAFGGDDDDARGPAFGAAQRADYYANRYHRTSDAYSEDWDVRGAIQDLNLEYHVGLRLSQTGRFPNWVKTSEFRAAREQSRESADD
jgi:Zn-dependent M28 family amino/carboxypeptidase